LKSFLFMLATVFVLLLSVVVGALFALPASYLAHALNQWSQGRVLALDTRGTIWNGRARLALRSGGQTETTRVAMLPGELHWRLGQIHWFEPAVELKLHGQPLIAQGFSVWISPNTAWLTPGALYMPAELLEGLGAPFNSLKPGGELWLSWVQASFESDLSRLQAVVEWSHAQSILSKVAPLGSYRMAITAQEGQGWLELTSLSGPLLLSGKGQWNRGRWQMTGVARAEPEQREALASFMTVLGPQQSDGSVQWKAGEK
jgi:general secretion pathway protein N